MYMFHVMATEYGWSHDDMMNMDKPTFFRYYGYVLSGFLEQEEHDKIQRREYEIKNNRR